MARNGVSRSRIRGSVLHSLICAICSRSGALARTRNEAGLQIGPDKYVYERSSEPITITDHGLLKLLLSERGRIGVLFGGSFRRSTIPCQRGFEALRVADVEHFGFTRLIPRLRPRMVNPFTVA